MPNRKATAPKNSSAEIAAYDHVLASANKIQSMIFTIRGVQVMVDRDLADVYGVESKRLNEQVKRNIERFPDTFRFQLSYAEKEELVANCDRFVSLKHSTSNPYVFTEQGVSMLSAVLRSETAVKVSIQIINAFVEMRRLMQGSASLFARLDSVEKRQLIFESKTAENFEKHNAQYPPIAIKTFKEAHDRFLIIDDRDIYHIGASLKDLGKKWFAFSKFETGALDMLKKLGGAR